MESVVEIKFKPEDYSPQHTRYLYRASNIWSIGKRTRVQ